jgi:hypothetical protein
MVLVHYLRMDLHPECVHFHILINVPDATLAPQLSTHKDLPRFDTSESFGPSSQYFAESSTTDLVSGIIDTETNFDWVSSHSSKLIHLHVSVLTNLERDCGIAISRRFQRMLCQLAYRILVHLHFSDGLLKSGFDRGPHR